MHEAWIALSRTCGNGSDGSNRLPTAIEVSSKLFLGRYIDDQELPVSFED
jgi:hypothetical protein